MSVIGKKYKHIQMYFKVSLVRRHILHTVCRKIESEVNLWQTQGNSSTDDNTNMPYIRLKHTLGTEINLFINHSTQMKIIGIIVNPTHYYIIKKSGWHKPDNICQILEHGTYIGNTGKCGNLRRIGLLRVTDVNQGLLNSVPDTRIISQSETRWGSNNYI